MSAFYAKPRPGDPVEPEPAAPVRWTGRIPVYTLPDAPVGYRVARTVGLCWGTSVRYKNLADTAAAGLNALGGGEAPVLTELGDEIMSHALMRMEEMAISSGGNAVLGFQIGVGPYWMTAYGTTVVIEPGE